MDSDEIPPGPGEELKFFEGVPDLPFYEILCKSELPSILSLRHVDRFCRFTVSDIFQYKNPYDSVIVASKFIESLGPSNVSVISPDHLLDIVPVCGRLDIPQFPNASIFGIVDEHVAFIDISGWTVVVTSVLSGNKHIIKMPGTSSGLWRMAIGFGKVGDDGYAIFLHYHRMVKKYAYRYTFMSKNLNPVSVFEDWKRVSVFEGFGAILSEEELYMNRLSSVDGRHQLTCFPACHCEGKLLWTCDFCPGMLISYDLQQDSYHCEEVSVDRPIPIFRAPSSNNYFSNVGLINGVPSLFEITSPTAGILYMKYDRVLKTQLKFGREMLDSNISLKPLALTSKFCILFLKQFKCVPSSALIQNFSSKHRSTILSVSLIDSSVREFEIESISAMGDAFPMSSRFLKAFIH